MPGDVVVLEVEVEQRWTTSRFVTSFEGLHPSIPQIKPFELKYHQRPILLHELLKQDRTVAETIKPITPTIGNIQGDDLLPGSYAVKDGLDVLRLQVHVSEGHLQ